MYGDGKFDDEFAENIITKGEEVNKRGKESEWRMGEARI
jgi:hypothetical protein